ncbi:glycosyltransferase family 2 protein [Sagittula salina]|uniref:Glycosyltransferase family 2 protein n=1 Tax=Sagittula salina TaxID=2820268 RepID=A0A940S0B4_9RHOB|nr:glycosyltransferase family 2 protein [Sagittula salina]MBP0481971.1 glycosyltransferase family 2 protein [Sagittula salina]
MSAPAAASSSWGTVTTVKAPLEAIQRFAAWHLEQGAHRVYIYLDEDVPETLNALKTHPKIRVMHTDADYWAKRKGRPEKHQVRQSMNARHCNNRKPEVDWLAHIDVDEFLIPDRPIANQLSAMPAEALCARVRPMEALAPMPGDAGPTAFKAFHRDQKARQDAAEACFPTWGPHLSGGFLSHVAGKLFFRTGLKGLQIKIHNVILNEVKNPGQADLPGIALGHFHANDWPHFLSSYRFRLERGSYRADLKPQVRRAGALSLHDLFCVIEADGGETALRAFFDEVCLATPTLCERLNRHGLLRRHDLDLDRLRAGHFA